MRHAILAAFCTTALAAACGSYDDVKTPEWNDRTSTGGSQASTGGASSTGGLGGFGSFDPNNPSMTYEVRDPGADMTDCTACIGDAVPANGLPELCCHGRQYFGDGVCSCVRPDGG